MTMNYSTRLTRAPAGYLGGVCEGLGRTLGIEPTLLRLLWLGAIFIGGTGIALYLLLWWLLPEDNSIPFEPSIWETGTDGIRRPPLERTHQDRKLLGVCGGLARRWDVDPSVLRLLGVAIGIVSLGTAAVVYFIAAMVIPSSTDAVANFAHPVDL